MRKFGMNSVIASIAKQSLLALFLSIALIACGGDSGTSPNSEEKDSSSSVQKDESSSSVKKQSSSSVTKTSSSSSVIPASSANRPSSSSKKGDAGTESGMTSSSSSKVSSSSSAKATSSSSSVKTVSSSSVALSSSSKQSSSSKKVESSSSQKIVSSSSVAPASSSSKKESSSSEYVPFDHSHALAADWRIGENRYKTFVDPRNGRSYYYITITGRDTNLTTSTITVMAENLNIGKMVLGENEQNDDSEIERYCYNNDTTKCDEFGGLYQWAEMMQLPSRCNTESCADLIQKNHQGICPEGWRLFTYNDYRIVRFSEGNEEHGVAGLRSGYRFNGYNTTGFSLVGAGYRSEEKKFENLNEYAFWFFPTEKASEKAYVGLISITNDDGISESDWSIKQEGLSVRCVKLE
ncbi:FISUMP domain-containing protein [Fibrobacter sp. UBA4297]|uniref:FISUMP domain-containing protein n=1 Tax=Fibrobacter sp. UBA4297 TaxID=1946536 RepID=UPI0025C14004|nr:FISUMP domain-containing protein [Fibrobacter sp. UBA4297]